MHLSVKRLGQFTAAQYAAAHSLLTAERRRSIDRIATPDDRRRSVLAEGLARQMLQAHTGVPARDIVITYGPSGKPYTPGAYFSISHSGDFVACAVNARPIGIDIEPVRALDLRLAPACCTRAEAELLASLPREERGLYLLRLWVLKEATVKCLGQDLRAASRHEFVILPDGRAGYTGAALRHTLCEHPEGYLLAVCQCGASGSANAPQSRKEDLVYEQVTR